MEGEKGEEGVGSKEEEKVSEDVTGGGLKRKREGDEEEEEEDGKEESGTNRRFSLRPRKRTQEEASQGFVQSSPNKRRRMTFSPHNQLETIFEEPLPHKSGKLLLLGLTKVKRYITFSEFVTKAKLKKRRAKAKRLRMNRKTEKKKVVTVQEVEGKLTMLDIDI